MMSKLFAGMPDTTIAGLPFSVRTVLVWQTAQLRNTRSTP